jgi:glycine/D-amino acid oxidase-like deaminating enzyme
VKQRPYWWDTVDDAADRAVVDVPIRADLAIVGGGYTGLAAAREAATAGATVAVLERERVGGGASSRNGGQVLTGLKLDGATLVARYGETRARELFEISRSAMATVDELIRDERLDCDYERTGHVQAAWKARHFDAFRQEQELLERVFAHPVRLVPRTEQHSELGTDTYYGLSIDEESAALNPAKFVHGLARAAACAGAIVCENAGVERLTRRGARWALATPRGVVEATEVLIATDGYTGPLTPALRRRLVPIGSYIIATEPLDAGLARTLIPRRRVAFDSKHFLYYFRIAADRRLLFGGRTEFTTPGDASTRRAAAALARAVTQVFPQLAGIGIEYAWGGNVALTRDQMPHAGRLDGIHYAAGYCGHGIAMATYLGRLIARRIADGALEHPLLDQPFPPIPLYSGRPWFLPFVGGYYRLRDWID